MMWVMAVAGLLSCGVGLIITPWLSRATSVRGPVMMPIIITLAVLGSFAAVTGFVGVVELGVFAVVGVVLRKVGYSLAAMTIGLVLGGTFADNVHLTQSIYGWSFIVHSPLADVFLLLSIALLVLITWRGRRGRAVITPERAARGPRSPHPVLEPATEAVIAVVSIIYMVIALGYPSAAGGVPAIIAAVAAAVALFRLAARGIGMLRHRTARGTLGAPTAQTAAPEAMDAALATVPAGYDAGAGHDSETSGGLESQPGPFGRRVGLEPEPEGSRPPADQPESGRRMRRTARELVALGWIWAAVAASYLLGFEVGVPVVAAAYCLTAVQWDRHWQRFTYAAVVTATSFGIAYAFVTLFSLTFSGVLI
jgi:hypothetical protein